MTTSTNHLRNAVALLAATARLAACAPRVATRPIDTPGRATHYRDPGTPSEPRVIGTESQDVVSMADRMVRSMLADPTLAGAAPNGAAPRVIVDSVYFRNQSADRNLDMDMITDRLRVDLSRAADGRMLFVNRHVSDMVEQERELKRGGVVDGGTLPPARLTAGADYRLSGRVTDLPNVAPGVRSNFMQFVFEMTDLETGMLVWADKYDFEKVGLDDLRYR